MNKTFTTKNIFTQNTDLFSRCLLVFFMLISTTFITQTYANNHFQAVNLTLSEALEQVAKEYAVSIIYDTEQIGKFSIKNWRMLGTNIEDELSKLVRGLDLKIKRLDPETFVIKQVKRPTLSVARPKMIQLKETTTSPVINATGYVLDIDDREPLIGVNIVVKGATSGTVTDLDGSFSISVEKGDLLVFSYVGYEEQTIRVNQAKLGEVLLVENASDLQEVVVVGYGTQKRSDLTGSLASIGEEELKALPTTGLDQALQGRAAGVLVTQNSGAPGGGVSVRIRGIGSTLTAEPLYVIDGIPVVNDNAGTSSNFGELDGGGQNSNALNTINPSDIESIEVLKDASATAIYGARAANGVVLITTKRGEKGRSTLSLDTYYGMQQLANKLPVLSLQEYADYYGDVGWDVIDEFTRPELLGQGTDWQDAVFRVAGMQNVQLTATGGTEQTRYALSGGYHLKEGIVVGSDFSRISGKINLDHKFNDRIRIGNSFLLSRTNENITFNDNSNGVVYTALLMVPNAPVRNVDGSFAGPQEEITLSFDNPVARALDTKDRNIKTRALANVYFEADIFPFLKYRTEFGTDIVYTNHNTFFPSFERGNFFGKSGVRRSLSNNLFWINKHLLTFNKRFAKDHNVTTLLGFEAQTGKYEWLFASRENLPTNDLQQLTLGDAGQQQNDGGAGHWALMSYFGRLNYGFSDRYLLTATLRVDGSSRFGPNNRYGIFPSVAVAWRLSNEGFLEDVDVLDNLKIRAGIGEVGNQEIGLYSYSSNLRSINVVQGDNLLTGFAPANIANPDVRWEASRQTNVGVDIGLFKNRIEIIADYYIKNANGMLLPALIPLTAGSLTPPFVNIGEIENSGIELSLNTVNTTGALGWRTTANFTKNTNQVINLGDNGSLVGLIQRIPVTRTVEGRPISQFYGYVTDGIFQNQAEVVESAFQSDGTRAGDIKFKDLNNDGIINDEDQTFLGNPLPDFTLNLTNDLEYKGISLSFFLQSVYGNEILNLLRRDTEGMTGLSNQSKVVQDRFRNNEPSTEIPRATGPDPNSNRRISDRFIEDGSFLRLRNLTLAYQFPKKLLRKWHFNNLRVYASGQNLLTWTSYSGYDPEIGSFNQNPLINGVDNGRYPIARSVTFGLSAGF
ncbi:MAG: SusC/RagA family TonB-linked outer membrane protein [Saprospiraceae bacterium]